MTIPSTSSDKPPLRDDSRSTLPPLPPIDPRRQRKQYTVILAGASFAVFSSLIARRAVLRRINWAKPTFFRQNDMHPEQQIDGGLEALEALSVATVNVFSWSIFWTGGLMWATDTYGLQEARSRLRVKLGLNETEQKDSQTIVGQWIQAAKFWKSTPEVKDSPTDKDS